MTWIIEELQRVLAQLRRWQTWAAIGVITLFALLAYLVGRLALRTDSVLTFLRVSAYSCHELTNGIIIFLFCGMIFFMLSAVLTLGELQRYFHLRQRGATHQARQALLWCSGYACLAIGIAVSALVFFNSFCR
ncbi:MAG: hypothetical protein CVU34_11550 [Betaproteobacteria bacterium HGW-Betaproteobacteria-7]|jgi:hypothetical protein|nr:MAG: hypothetical protein CVU34_11550 [Betaproteobacteria bacterium HGW-Betaproteobacteria-7]